MKKLMFTAALAALAGVAGAIETYDYKASVKHTYIKAKYFSKAYGAAINDYRYIKYTKTSSLQGYLVQDNEGKLWTSSAIISGTKDLQPGNRCFLVVKNKSAEKDYQGARILPAVLEAKWYDDKLNNPASKPAQGILYVGGEAVTTLAGTTFDAKDGQPNGYVARALTGQWQRNPANTTIPGGIPQTIAIDDYWFTSCYLFGQYNQPSWNGSNLEEFGDAWMNHAGFGKAAYYNNMTACCGKGFGGAGTVLDSLSGNLKAGLYLCSENGDNASHTGFSRQGIAEDQLWLGVRSNWGLGYTYSIGVGGNLIQKLDIWADGNLDLRSTDVGYGTWSIKRTTKLNGVALTTAENNKITTDWSLANPGAKNKEILEVIKGAMVKLDSKAALFGDPTAADEMINFSFYKNYLAQ